MLDQIIKIVLVSLSRVERPISTSTLDQACRKITPLFPDQDVNKIMDEVRILLDNPESIKKALRTARTKLPDTPTITDDEIERTLDQIMSDPDYAGLSRKSIKREIQTLYSIRSEPFRIIETPSERKLPWLNSRRDKIEWRFWSRYRFFLQDKKGFAPDTVSKLDRLTYRVLDSLFDPTADIQIDKRGMVVGQVQSGKTSNYTGLICKAADAGFKLIIVLSGIHENLRSQTQLRLDEGFLGFDTRNARAFNTSILKMGVGEYGDSSCVAHSLTSSEHRADFNESKFNSLGINFETPDPILVVTKKHSRILENLERWLSLHTSSDNMIHTKSALIIDDEADNASINTNKSDRDPTTINRRIRGILSLFRKSAYIGYTATPFANIFIPVEDDNLFPRDFIVNIPPPSDYIGPEKVFGFSILEEEGEPDNVLPIVTRIEDHSALIPDKHKKDDPLPSELPESLKLAIRCFILSCAVKRLRGQVSVHNSMLVHVSRFQRWQDHITYLIQNQFDYYKLGIDQHDPLVMKLFRHTFEDDRAFYNSYPKVSELILKSSLGNIDANIQIHKWEDLLPHLGDAASRIQVRAIHGGSGEALDYYDHKAGGLSIIAVGGNKLSRGLTLEGLTISYYLRSSKMYDTLMQMGRWFGYRRGYVDLCRLFTSQELNEWFCHITRASEELREEFDYMSDVAGSTPEQYALRVRTHPGALQISATNKLRSAVTINISHAGRLVESYEFKKDAQIINHNYNITQSYFKSLPNDFVKSKNNFIWYDRPADEVITFLSKFKTPENLKPYAPQSLIRFIKNQLPNEELTQWRVALMSKQNAQNSFYFEISGNTEEIGTYIRKEDEKESDHQIYFLRRSHIISPKDEFIDLSEDEYEEAMKRTKKLRIKQEKEGEPLYPSGQIVRNEVRSPRNPLLLIYLLDSELSLHAFPIPKNKNPFVGYAISFPRSNHNAFVSYAVNEQLLDKFNFEDNEEDFNDDED